MDKISKKIMVIFLIMAFILQPLLQIIFSLGNVYAANVTQYQTVITTQKDEIWSKVDTSKVNVKLVSTQTRSYVKYRGSYSIINMSKYSADQINENRHLLGFSTDGKYRNIDFFLTNVTKTKHKEGWTVGGVIEGTIVSPWYDINGTKPSLPNITVNDAPHGHRFSRTMSPWSWQSTGEYRYYYNITPKSTTSSSSGSLIENPSLSANSIIETGNIAKQLINNAVNNYNGSGASYSGSTTVPIVNTDVEKVINLSDNEKKIYIQTLYRRVLKRNASKNEIEIYMKFTPREIASNIILSPESDEKNKINSISNEQYIKLCYNFILGRQPDSEGLKSHTNLLNNTNNKVKAIRNFIESDEFYINRTRAIKQIILDENIVNSVFNSLINQGFEVVKLDSKTILMFEENVANVKTLDLSGNKLTNLNGISIFTNITKLIAQNNSLTDISELSRMDKLTCLNLNNNNLKSNMTQICNLTNLTELYIDGTGITDSEITEITKLNKLQKLSINNNGLTQLNVIAGITSLKELYADNNKIKNIDNLNVEKLSLKNQTSQCEVLTNEMDLFGLLELAKDENSLIYTDKNFECENCKYENEKIKLNSGCMTGIVTIKGGPADGSKYTYKNVAKVINFNDKVLADRIQSKLGNIIIERKDENNKYTIYISNSELNKVENLDLSANEQDNKIIVDLSGIENFTALKNLNLSNNRITNLGKIEGLKKLETLTIRNNNLTNLNGLRNVKSLKQLDVSLNFINDISGISELTNLDAIILNYNRIGNNLLPLNKLSNSLSVLSIDNNNVSDLSKINSLQLEKFYGSYNKIESFYGLNQDYIDDICMNNNTIELTTDQNEIDLPDILKRVIAKEGVSNIQCTGCTIRNNKIVFNSGSVNGKLTVKSGYAADTNVIVKKLDVEPPVLSVVYNLNQETGFMEVTLRSNEQIQDVYRQGWILSDNNTKLKKTYEYNTKETLVIKDLAGNETEKEIKIDNVVNENIPGLRVEYSNYNKTNGTVTLVIKSDVELFDYNWNDWQISQDKKQVSRVFDDNINGTINMITKENYDNNISGKAIQVQYKIENIDKVAPQIKSVEYNTDSVTKGAVIATIWSDEEISLTGNTNNYVSKVTSTDEMSNKIYGISLMYLQNTNEMIEVKDLAGNTATALVNISNMDNSIDGLKILTTGITATNLNQVIKIQANENIRLKNGIQTFAQKGLQFANSIKQTAIDSPLFKVASTLPIMYLANNEDINNELIDNSLDNEITIDVSEGQTGILGISDDAGNSDVVLYNTNHIDKQAPSIGIEKQEVQEDGSVLITLVSNEPIQNTDGLSGWTLSEDGLRLTKIFISNGNEQLVIKDMADNETIFDLEVRDVNCVKNEIYYQLIEGTDRVLVVITADTELKPVDGWELLEDKKSIAKIFMIDQSETVQIEDILGYGSEVEIKSFEEIEKYNQQSEQSQETNDDTMTDKILPQTGIFTIVGFVVVFEFAVYAFISHLKYKNMLKK